MTTLDESASSPRETDSRESSLKLRLILLSHGGAEEVLTRLLSPEVDVVGIFVETETTRNYGIREKIKRSIRYDGYAKTFSKLARKLFRLDQEKPDIMALLKSRDELERIARAHGIAFHLVSDYHAPETIALMREANADLGVIYGTNIIKESVFRIPRLGSINLHQRLAPHYRGGPPVFWELYNGESELGLTVHYVAAKVDSGDIILQETMPLKYEYSYGDDYESFISDFCAQLHSRCAELVAQAVHLIARGTASPKPQDASLGRRYRLPSKSEKDELRRRLRSRKQKPADGWASSHAEI